LLFEYFRCGIFKTSTSKRPSSWTNSHRLLCNVISKMLYYYFCCWIWFHLIWFDFFLNLASIQKKLQIVIIDTMHINVYTSVFAFYHHHHHHPAFETSSIEISRQKTKKAYTPLIVLITSIWPIMYWRKSREEAEDFMRELRVFFLINLEIVDKRIEKFEKIINIFFFTDADMYTV
jgi:hypothetical protein